MTTRIHNYGKAATTKMLNVSLVLALALTMTSCISGPENVVRATPAETESQAQVEPQYSQAQLDGFKAAVDQLAERRDEVTRSSSFLHPRGEFFVDQRSAVYPYIQVPSSGKPRLAVRIGYVGSSWIFWDSYILASGDLRVTNSVDYFDVQRDNGSGKVWEYYTITDQRTAREMLEAIASTSTSTLRLQGDGKSRDLQLGRDDQQIAQTILRAFAWVDWKYENPN